MRLSDYEILLKTIRVIQEKEITLKSLSEIENITPSFYNEEYTPEELNDVIEEALNILFEGEVQSRIYNIGYVVPDVIESPLLRAYWIDSKVAYPLNFSPLLPTFFYATLTRNLGTRMMNSVVSSFFRWPRDVPHKIEQIESLLDEVNAHLSSLEKKPSDIIILFQNKLKSRLFRSIGVMLLWLYAEAKEFTNPQVQQNVIDLYNKYPFDPDLSMYCQYSADLNERLIKRSLREYNYSKELALQLIDNSIIRIDLIKDTFYKIDNKTEAIRTIKRHIHSLFDLIYIKENAKFESTVSYEQLEETNFISGFVSEYQRKINFDISKQSSETEKSEMIEVEVGLLNVPDHFELYRSEKCLFSRISNHLNNLRIEVSRIEVLTSITKDTTPVLIEKLKDKAKLLKFIDGLCRQIDLLLDLNQAHDLVRLITSKNCDKTKYNEIKLGCSSTDFAILTEWFQQTYWGKFNFSEIERSKLFHTKNSNKHITAAIISTSLNRVNEAERKREKTSSKGKKIKPVPHPTKAMIEELLKVL